MRILSNMEEWKEIKDYPNYMVSNMGRVKSLNFRGNTGKEHLRKIQKNKYGYLMLFLSKEGKQKGFTIHRLVYEAFVGEIPQGMQVNHINEIKTDNRLENLNLMTPKENINWGTANERRSKAHTGKFVSKETREKIGKIRSIPILQLDKTTNYIINEWPNAEEVQRQLGLNHSHIRDCCNGKRKTCGGFKWQNKIID